MKDFNTLSGKKENLVPIKENKIKMYVCGMTVYDDTHIGHARTFISFDLIVRYLRSINYEVHYIAHTFQQMHVSNTVSNLSRPNRHSRGGRSITRSYVW